MGKDEGRQVSADGIETALDRLSEAAEGGGPAGRAGPAGAGLQGDGVERGGEGAARHRREQGDAGVKAAGRRKVNGSRRDERSVSRRRA